MPRNALGKGLSALIQEPEQQSPRPQAPAEPALAAATAAAAVGPAPIPLQAEGLLQADIDLIEPSPYQPRSHFRQEALDELARSIRASGIVQPLVVRRVGARYQLIAGERRWRAAQLAGLTRVPAILRDVANDKALEMTLVENLQREDLNPIEQARAFQRLTNEFTLTQEQVAERTGKDRTSIANALRLLKLEAPVQELLEDGKLSAGHGRALLAFDDPKVRVALARRIVRRGMTVRQIERLAARALRPRPTPRPFQPDANTRAALDRLQQEYGTRVTIGPPAAGKPGHLTFEYYDDKDLVRLYQQLMQK